MAIAAWDYLWISSVPLVYMHVFKPVPCCFCYCGSADSLKSGVLKPPVLFLFSITLASHSLLCFHMNFKFPFSIFVKDVTGILMGTAFKLNIVFGNMAF
jgi:hypothetical protein